jgi:hypothetical protein
MNHLPGTELTEGESLDWGKYVGIDEDGSARVFKKEPVKIGDVWAPDEFPAQGQPGCYRINAEYPESKHGRLLKRKKSGGEKSFVPVPKKEENHYDGNW